MCLTRLSSRKAPIPIEVEADEGLELCNFSYRHCVRENYKTAINNYCRGTVTGVINHTCFVQLYMNTTRMHRYQLKVRYSNH